jgi:hypothetical protein
MDQKMSSSAANSPSVSVSGDTPPNIGPRQIDSGTGQFILDIPGWPAAQAYVTAGMHLPTDTDDLRAQLPADPPGGMDQFSSLVSAYALINQHCKFWNDHTLQDAVNCAADIVHYNQKVPSYYGALSKLLPGMTSNPPNAAVVTQFKAILQNLSTQAQGYADHAAAVKKGMKDFADQTAQDQLNVQPLMERFHKSLGDQSPIIKQLSDDLAADQQTLSEAQAEYEHDVIVAATSATYAWVWPVGTIAAGVVAGVYGKRATDALARVNGMKAAIGTISGQLSAAANLLLVLQSIDSQLADISTKIAAALPVLQAMQGAWTSIASDMQNILTIIDQDIGKAPAIIASLGIDNAIAAWARVAKEADVYRNTAFITVTDDMAKAKAAGLLVHGSLAAIAQRGQSASNRLAAA